MRTPCPWRLRGTRPEGFEPPTRRLEVCRSIQLSYGRRGGAADPAGSDPNGRVALGPTGPPD
jgi:hypothetical protein